MRDPIEGIVVGFEKWGEEAAGLRACCDCARELKQTKSHSVTSPKFDGRQEGRAIPLISNLEFNVIVTGDGADGEIPACNEKLYIAAGCLHPFLRLFRQLPLCVPPLLRAREREGIRV